MAFAVSLCWQTSYVQLNSRIGSRWNVLLAVGLVGLLSACSADSDAQCSSSISVSDYVSGFSQGLDNFSEDRYVQLRDDSNSAYERTVNAVTEESVTAEATAVAAKIATFISVMDTVDWDVNRALNVLAAIEAASELGSELTLRQANAVEGELIARCGMPETVAPPTDNEVTLPMNSIPSPNATDPPMDTVDDSAELTVIGKMVADQFGLSVTDVQAACLGKSLSNVYDASGPSSNSAQYQSQFQRAFDSCGIVFDVPSQ
jgi:hypothetical protein